jgi:hypothetical protein
MWAVALPGFRAKDSVHEQRPGPWCGRTRSEPRVQTLHPYLRAYQRSRILANAYILQRHKFTASFTLEALRDTLSWRLSHRPNGQPSNNAIQGLMFCPPQPTCDVLERPIVIIRLSALKDTYDIAQVQKYVLFALEKLRYHLTRLNSGAKGDTDPILQYVLLLDMELSMRTLDRVVSVLMSSDSLLPPSSVLR